MKKEIISRKKQIYTILFAISILALQCFTLHCTSIHVLYQNSQHENDQSKILEIISCTASNEDFYYFWNGTYSQIIDPDNLYYWNGTENFTYIGSNSFLVNETKYDETSGQIKNYSRKVNNGTRIISEQNPPFWKDGSHEWVWIHTNIQLNDTVNITIYTDGDSEFNVTGETVISALNRNFSVWILVDSIGSTAYYDKYSGILISGLFYRFGGALNHTINVTSTNVTLEPNNFAPHLENGNVSPLEGITTTEFNFTVNYSDADNNEPISVNVNINGTIYSMEKINSSDSYYVDGVLYQFVTFLQSGNYTCNFSCSDNSFSNQTNDIIGPNVTLVNANPPVLSEGVVTPDQGFNNTNFLFSVNYSDTDNNAPSYINVTINSTPFEMEKQNSSDVNYVDGVIYQYLTTLLEGNYEFYFNTSDGLNEVGFPISNPISGPNVSAFQNYTMYENVIFEWIDATDGILLSLSDDDSSTQALPFNFQFYNETYSTIHVSSNGYCSFTDTNPVDPTEDSIPSTDADNQRLIALLWDDLNPNGENVIYVKNLTSPNRWVLEYYQIKHKSFSDQYVEGTFQLILYETGEIKFQFLEVLYYVGYSSGLNFGDGSYFNKLDSLSWGLRNYSVLFIFDGSVNNTPTLTSLGVDKSQGYTTDTFKYRVEYRDADNDAPSYVRIIIDGVSFDMQKETPADTNYVDGVIYYYQTTLTAGTHTYRFETSDGFYEIKEPTASELQGPTVTTPTLPLPSLGPLEILMISLGIIIPVGAVAGAGICILIYKKRRKTLKTKSVKLKKMPELTDSLYNGKEPISQIRIEYPSPPQKSEGSPEINEADLEFLKNLKKDELLELLEQFKGDFLQFGGYNDHHFIEISNWIEKVSDPLNLQLDAENLEALTRQYNIWKEKLKLFRS
ncbi:MAG: hypothetical protein ACTSRB_11305 [Candidatus Helarchaeota archaeon]